MPKPLAPRDFWILFLFRSRPTVSGDAEFRNELNLFLGPDADGQLSLVLDDGEGNLTRAAGSSKVPIGSWFHVEAYQRIASDETGELRVWQDGVVIHDVRGITSHSPYVEWLLGVVVDGLTTDASDLYIDDAAITRRRLGPDAGPFIRR